MRGNKRIWFLVIFYLLSGFCFSQDSAFVLKEISISGNKKTKRTVLLREISSQPGDSVCCPVEFQNTVYNRLTGTGLFNLVVVKLTGDTLYISVTEKIYLWPYPQLYWADRNFNVWWQTKDPSRLIYGAFLFHNNVGGLHHTAYVGAIGGYNKILEFGYAVPFRKYNRGWGFGMGAYYWTNHELWYKTENNRLQFLRLEDRKIQENIGLEIMEKRRFNYFNRVEFKQGWWRQKLDSAAIIANSDYTLGDTIQQEWYAGLEWVSDHRDQRDYPTKGYLIRGGFKYGLLQSLVLDPFNQRRMEGYTALSFRISHFNTIGGRPSLVFAKSLVFRLLSGNLPYNYTRQLGYGSDYVRGYEPYVADGLGIFLVKTGLRKALLKNFILRLPTGRILRNYKKMPLSIWFNIFADAGRIIQPEIRETNDLNMQWQCGTGLGLDFVSWYNGLIRAEYSFNRMGEGYFNLSYKNAF